MEQQQQTAPLKSAQPGNKVRNRFPNWAVKLVLAGGLTIFIHFIFLFVIYGEVSGLTPGDGFEIFFTFLYFISLFWVYPRISRFMNSEKLSRLPGLVVKIIESITVVVATFFLTGLMKIFPLWILLFFVNGYFHMDNLRRSLVVHAFIALFFYYFVERERIKKNLRVRYIRNAKIQEEYMEWQLRTLKNQVNPEFLFKSLNSLDDLIEKDEERSVELVNRLSHLYRLLLEHKEQLTHLRTELELVKAYEDLLQLTADKKISFEYDIFDTYRNHQLPPGVLYKITECYVNGSNVTPGELILKIYTQDEQINISGPLLDNENTDLIIGQFMKTYELFTERTIEKKKEDRNLTITLPLLPLAE